MSARDGLSQRERLAAALKPHYVDVDELSLPQLLMLAMEFAKQVRFSEAYTPAAQQSSWKPYFLSDETMVMADILSTRLADEKVRFAALLEQVLAAPPASGAPIEREQLITFTLYRWSDKLRQWADGLLHHGGSSGADLGMLIGELLTQMPPELARIVAFYDSRLEWDPHIDLAVLTTELGDELRLMDNGRPDRALVRSRMKSWFHQLMKAVEMTQHAAAQRLPQSLHSGRHEPGVSLLLAFAQLYRAAQQKVNRFTERHLDFYYEKVLGVRPNGPVRDSTFLVFPPGNPGTSVTVPAGTAFLAAFDKSQPELVFSSEYDAVVTDTRVAEMHTLFVQRAPLSSPENRMVEFRHGVSRRYPSACYWNTITPLSADAAVDTTKLAAYPLFGAPRSSTMTASGRAARIGFLLASNVLLMQEGERFIQITLSLGRDLQDDGEAHTSGETLSKRLDALAKEMGHSVGEVHYKVLRRLFNVSVSGAAGWIAIPEYSAEFVSRGEAESGKQSADADSLTLYLRLGADAGAIVPYHAAIHGESYRTDCPLVRFELNDQGYLYPYGLLRGLPLIKAKIDVSVTGHRNLVLQSNIGQLSAAAPFQPFGPLPALGSYLVVGCAETVCKRLTSFDLVMEWGGLPRDPGGFAAYYGGYRNTGPGGDPGIQGSFSGVKVTPSALIDGKWSSTEGERSLTLFDPALASAGNAIAPVDTLRLKPLLRYTRPLARLAEGQPFLYTPSAKGGFFKLTLTEPEFAFGHRDYPLMLSAALTHNNQPRYRRHLWDIPNPPYTPLVDSISLNYAATATIVPTPNQQGDAFFRITPSGFEAARAAGDGGDYLVPQIDYSGALYLGLAASRLNGPLTLYFHLLEDALPMVELESRQLQWSYLSDNRWIPFPSHAVRVDSTRAFLRSGIVVLTLPSDVNRNNTIMPADLYWIRVACEQNLEKFSSLYSVHAHAVQVWRQLSDATLAAAGAGAPEVIPAGSIKRPRQALPGLGQVTQMNASFGGRLAESKIDMRRRTAERLRHKGRAVTAEDYERLILEQFPQIDRVKCFPNLSMQHGPNGEACPGHVLLVGLPPFQSRGHLAILPRLNGDLIGQVREFIAARISPAVTLEVANPVYQQIQVRCKVKLVKGADEGWYVNTLDRVISDCISPWNAMGNTSHFGWTIRQHDIESAILSIDGVLGVTQFSMLSVSGESRDRFSLTDTAGPGVSRFGAADLAPAYPWSIAVPIKRHLIEIADSEQSQAALRTGIGQLEIGNTFIISADENHDDTQ